MANLREMGVAITHQEMNLPYNQMPRFTFDPDQIQMDEYNIGQPSLLWYRNREGQGGYLFI